MTTTEHSDLLGPLREKVREASSDILKMVMEAMADPEGGIGIDQVEALILGHIEPALQAGMERVRGLALEEAAQLTLTFCDPGKEFSKWRIERHPLAAAIRALANTPKREKEES